MQRVRISAQQSPVHKLGNSQITLSPKFRFSSSFAWPSPPSSMESDSDLLIPGLPDDVSLNCLLRLPVAEHPSCRSVCRRWHDLLATKDRFFAHRKILGLRRPWLFVLAFDRCTDRIRWQVLDLHHFSWHSIPAMPCRDRVWPHGFGCVALPAESALLVCGGMVSDVDCPLHIVMKYEMYKNRWTVVSSMLSPRSFFAGRVIDGTVYVAGGFSAEQFELSSAEALCLDAGKWLPIASMGANMAAYDSAVLDGKLLVTEGWVWPFVFSPRGQVYDPKADTWEPMAAGLREGWTGLSAVVDGKLFVVSEHERMRVKVYDEEMESWEDVEGSPLPESIRKPFAVGSDGRRIFVVGQGLEVAVGHVAKKVVWRLDRRRRTKWRFGVQWAEVAAPGEFSDLTPSSAQVLFA